jgi:ribosomal protein S12 methylthiotransferase
LRDTIKIYFDTMGCSKNLADSEYALGRLVAAGFERTDDPFAAQIAVVNTCGFINDAKQESIERILELAALKEEGECLLLVATGCLTQRYREELTAELPEVDILLGTEEYDKLPEMLWQALSGMSKRKIRPPKYETGEIECGRVMLTPAYTAYLKIAEGCDNCCTFCAIPNIRGALKSRPLEELVEEAAALKQSGVKELCLIAQDTTAYGQDLAGRSLLADLLREIDKLGFDMLRVLYSYPEGIDDELLATMRDCKTFCHYLDIPIQHVSKDVVRRMNRHLSRAEIEALLVKIREYMPDAAIRTTLMVGFPGETDEEFAELLDWAGEAELDWAGVFRYSQEEGTPAAVMPNQVDEDVKARRYNQLMAVLADVSAGRREAMVGRQLRVLLEQPSLDFPGYFEARSVYHAPEVDGVVYVENLAGDLSERHIGKLVDVEITEAASYDLIAVLKK